MVMQEQARRLSEPLQWGRQQKLALGFALSLLVIALAGLGVYALTSGAAPRRDCVSVTFASTLGGGELHGCGGKARAICASGSFPHITGELRAACARAGFAYKPPS
ncbi:MAG TPA: hypothetical protein VHT27_01220 [Solirubrobacteraceae bacterium]|jgi:hypothetical protein|nr:hypothetical protein [Solirubrobacteraceae bacterium]